MTTRFTLPIETKLEDVMEIIEPMTSWRLYMNSCDHSETAVREVYVQLRSACPPGTLLPSFDDILASLLSQTYSSRGSQLAVTPQGLIARSGELARPLVVELDNDKEAVLFQMTFDGLTTETL
jgi:hypothetical protein